MTLPASNQAKPQRIQLKRTKGWKMPPNTVKVDRTTRYGNPWRPGDPGTVQLAFGSRASIVQLGKQQITVAGTVHRYRCWLEGRPPFHVEVKAALDESVHQMPAGTLLPEREWRDWVLANVPALRGKNLACWCKVGDACHADVLLRLANL